MGELTGRIHAKLTQALAPSQMELVDESENHRGHGGYKEGGESHFALYVVSDAFTGLNRVARHRLVNDVLAEELAGPVHALALKLDIP